MDDRTRAAKGDAPAPRARLDAPGDAFVTSWADFATDDDRDADATPPESSHDEDRFVTPWGVTVTINITDADSPTLELRDSPLRIPDSKEAAERTPHAHRR